MCQILQEVQSRKYRVYIIKKRERNEVCLKEFPVIVHTSLTFTCGSKQKVTEFVPCDLLRPAFLVLHLVYRPHRRCNPIYTSGKK